MSATYPNRRAFALPELLALALIALCVIAFLSLAAHDSRRRSRAAGSIDNLRFFGSGTQTYAADHADKFWTFTWRAGVQNTEHADPNVAFNDFQAAANQAVYILRTIGQAIDMAPVVLWMPHLAYSHLPLWQHLGLQLPSSYHLSPEDSLLRSWQRDANSPGGTVRLGPV